MNLIGSSYVPEVFTRLIKEGLKIYENYARDKINEGVLTLGEIREDMTYWKESMSLFYENLGWDSKLIKILGN